LSDSVHLHWKVIFQVLDFMWQRTPYLMSTYLMSPHKVHFMFAS